MAEEFDHNRVLNAAAREVLKPLGLARKGRSRTYLDDRGWWLGVVEFQPHKWMRGSFLNVGVDWHWRDQEFIAYSVGGRVDHDMGEPPSFGFLEAQDEEQFGVAARELARIAAGEVEGYRRRFADIEGAAAYLDEHAGDAPWQFWEAFDAGVACGLAGRAEDARRWFGVVRGHEAEQDWERVAHERAAELTALLADGEAFGRDVCAAMRRRRSALGLDERAEIAFCR